MGDGANDLPMLGKACLGIAFRAKPIVRESATSQQDYHYSFMVYVINPITGAIVNTHLRNPFPHRLDIPRITRSQSLNYLCDKESKRRSIKPDIDRQFGGYRLQARGIEFQGTLPLFVS